MNLKKIIKDILTKSCIYFSVITAIYSFIALIINVNDDVVLLNAGNILLYFLFSILLSVANKIFTQKTIHVGVRAVLHFLICAIAFYSCFLLPISPTPTGMLIGMITFIILYFIIAGIVALFSSRLKKNIQKSEAYTHQFKK